MNRIISVVMLALVLVCGGSQISAQKKSGSASKSSSASTQKSYPDIVNRTFYYKMKDGATLKFQFIDKETCNVIVYDAYEHYESECPYTYEKGYVKIFDPNVLHTPMFDGRVSSDGKTIKLSSGYTMKS